MVLQSQVARASTRRAYMYRRHRRHNIPFLIVALLVLGGGGYGAVRYWPTIASAGGRLVGASATTMHNDAEQPETIGAADDDWGDIASLKPPSRPTGVAADTPRTESNVQETTPRKPRVVIERPEARGQKNLPTRSPNAGADPNNHTRAQRQADRGATLWGMNQPVQAREALSRSLLSGRLEQADAAEVRSVLTEINERLVFSPEVVPEDPFAWEYIVRPDDFLSTIANENKCLVHWSFLRRINGLPSASIRSGQRLKLIRGPFHAVIYKSVYRLDLYMGAGGNRVYVRSFAVGLGEDNSTPTGRFRVRRNSKLENPAWTSPRTGEKFASNNPNNPIGEYWIGVQGLDQHNKDMTGYGIHGTIAPESIGQQSSMGCVRMLPGDIAIVYEVLSESASTIEIRP